LGKNCGVVPLDKALSIAEESNLDLVELTAGKTPPVCKVIDYGKYKYAEQKKANLAKKKQKIISVKEIKMRPTIDQHDYEFKMKAMKKFLGSGDKVKVTLRFRGRELAHKELGMELMDRSNCRKTTKVGRESDDNDFGSSITISLENYYILLYKFLGYLIWEKKLKQRVVLKRDLKLRLRVR
jgi:translation initiation factor IF-3